MRDDDQLEPSLPLARHEIAHREHEKHRNHALRHQHNHRQVTATAEASVVTEVTATISIVQQIDVDSNGNTISVLTVTETVRNESPAVLTDSSSPTTASSNAASGAVSTASNTPVETSCSSNTVDFNSTTITSSSTSLSTNFANSTSFSSGLSSRLTYLTSSSLSNPYDVSLTTTLLSSSGALRTISLQSTGVFGGVVGGTAVTSGTATSTTAASGNSTNSGIPVQTRAVVGGVVGSVAGVAVIALLLLFLIKWRKNPHGALLSLGSGRDSAGDGADVATREPPQPSGGMVERRSFAYAVPAALASLTGYKRSSRQTDQTVSSTGASERGFYRVSGRKLPSVLQTGGDGYGGGVPDDHTLSGSSFYRDSHGFYGGPGTPTFPPVETHQESDQTGTAVMRPSPARTPVTEQGRFSTAGPPDLNPLPPRPDVLGRSHPSQDGSHASRFIEEV